LIWLTKCQAGRVIRLPVVHGFVSEIKQWTAELAEAAINDG
jgi:hypothetical protein